MRTEGCTVSEISSANVRKCRRLFGHFWSPEPLVIWVSRYDFLFVFYSDLDGTAVELWWKDRENRSSRSWDNLAQVKKEEITEGKIYCPVGKFAERAKL